MSRDEGAPEGSLLLSSAVDRFRRVPKRGLATAPGTRWLEELLADLAPRSGWREIEAVRPLTRQVTGCSSSLLTGTNGCEMASVIEESEAEALSRILAELRAGIGRAWGRRSPIDPWEEIPADAWNTLTVPDLSQNIAVSVAAAFRMYRVHVCLSPDPEPLSGHWDYFDQAALRAAKRYLISPATAESAVASAVFSAEVPLAVFKNGEYQAFTGKIARPEDIHVSVSAIFPYCYSPGGFFSFPLFIDYGAFDEWLRSEPNRRIYGLLTSPCHPPENCQTWLERETRRGPPQHPKREYRIQACERFSISARRFGHIWSSVMSQPQSKQNGWGQPGRRRKQKS